MLIQIPRRFRQPYSDEALTGYVSECAATYAAHPTALLEGADCPLSMERLPFLSRDQSDRLAHLLSQDPQTIADMTYQTLHRDRKIPLVLFHAATLRRSHLLASRRRLSPAAMRESNHIRALSTVSAIDFCCDSWTELTDSCLNCGQGLTWADLPHVSACHRCGADQRDFHTAVVPVELRNSLETWVGLIHPLPTQREEATQTLAAPLRLLEPGIVFDLVLGLSDTMRGGATKLESIAAAMTAVKSWPDSILHALADDEAVTGDHEPLTSRLRRYASLPTTLTPVRELLLYDLTLHRGVALGARAEIEREVRRLDGLSVREAGRYLGIAPTEVITLRRAGVLQVTAATRGRMRRELLTSSSCFNAREQLMDRMSICEFVRETGLSEHAVEELLTAGRLSKLENPAVEALFERPVLVRSVAQRFVDQLRSSVTPLGYDDDDFLPLKDAFKAVGGRPKPYVALFDKVFADRCGIRAPLTADEKLNLTQMHVSPMILHALDDFSSIFANSEILSLSVAKEILNCGGADLEGLIERRVLVAIEDQICSRSVQRAARKYISFEEINARLGYQERVALGWLRRHGLDQILPGFASRKVVREKLGAVIPLGTWRRVALQLSIKEIRQGRGDLSVREWDMIRGWYPRQRKSAAGVCDRRVTNCSATITESGRRQL